MADKKGTKRKATERIYLTEDEIKMLEGYLVEWSEKPDKRNRDAFVVAEILPKVQALNLEKCGPEIISRDKAASILWDRRVKAVHGWFKNNRPFKNRAVFRLERKIPLRRVVGKVKATEIHNRVIAQNADIEKGDKTYPGLFQKVLSDYMRGMEKTEVEELERVRGEWQDSGPPVDVQLRAAKRYSRRGIINAHELLNKEMAVSCMTYSWFPDPDTGVLGVVCHDYISGLHAKASGTKLKTFREWNEKAHHRIVADMMGYAQYVQTHRNEDQSVLESEVPLKYENGPGMLPLLPSVVKGVRGGEIATGAKQIIRSYFQRHYTLASGDLDTKTPWAKISDDPSRFFHAECYPTDFKFDDPSRMGKSVKILLNHLRERQESLGVNGFHFHHYYKDKVFHVADYPEEAKIAIEAGAALTDGPTSNTNVTETKLGAHTSRSKQSKQEDKRQMTSPIKMDITSTPATTTDWSSPGASSWDAIAASTMAIEPNAMVAPTMSIAPMPDGRTTSSAPIAPMSYPFAHGMPGFGPLGYHPMAYAYPPHMIQATSHVPGLTNMNNIDPRLWPGAHQHQNAPPDGNPFSTMTSNMVNPMFVHSNSLGLPPAFPQMYPPVPHGRPASTPHDRPSSTDVTPPMPTNPLIGKIQQIAIKPPTFSPSTPSRSPRKRKREAEAGIVPTPSRPKRNVTTPKRYADNGRNIHK